MISEKSIRNLLSKVAILKQKWIALRDMKAVCKYFYSIQADSVHLKKQDL